MSKRTATIHRITGSNDMLSDTGWLNITLWVGVDHENDKLIDVDLRNDLLERRLERDGWSVVTTFTTFTHNGERWVVMKEDN